MDEGKQWIDKEILTHTDLNIKFNSIINDEDLADAVTKKHAATLIGTKTIDETDIANTKVIAYNSTSGNLEYESAGTADAHAATHVTGGGDTIANVIAAGNAGLMTGADKTKLNGIEALADVTDAINVNAAGAVMTTDTVNVLSDITSTGTNIEDAVTKKHAATLIGTKTIDETDIANTKVIAYNSTSGNLEYESAGTADAHAATHVTGGGDTIANVIAAGNAGLMTGADKTKLNGIEALADVTDAINVNAAGAVMNSDYVDNWTIRTSAADNNWRSICWSPGLSLFCAVAIGGTGNRVMTSPDGINWTIRTSAADNNWYSVCWSPGLSLFCAVAYTGTGNRVMTSPDGINWTIRTSAADNSWFSVCWSPGLSSFCAVAISGTGNRVMTSLNNNPVTTSNGLTWSVISANTNAAIGHGYFINASGGSVTLTLPASPSTGNTVAVCDFYNKATTNTITIARNTKNIEGTAENLIININGAGFTMVYSDTTRGWEIVTEI